MNNPAQGIGPWSNVYGLARSSLALGTLLTLLFNDPDLLFRPLTEEVVGLYGRTGLAKYTLFLMVSSEHLQLARWLAIAVLLVVVSGWRPRLTGIAHWWISFSVAMAVANLDGGDQIAAVLSLLLIPVTLTDSRKWHWSRAAHDASVPASIVAAETAWSTLLVIRLQVAMVYFHAGTAKMGVGEWADGTALYYWFSHPVYGLSTWLEPVIMPLLAVPFAVTWLTWGVIIFELALFLGLALDKQHRHVLLKLGLLFHFGILVVHGLVSFFFSMAAALILFLRPAEQEFRVPARVRAASASLAGRIALGTRRLAGARLRWTPTRVAVE
jgi:antimicrobial peptide system SdpB family protein